MSAIDTYIEEIETAIYGEEVRSSIINAIKQCYEDASEGLIPSFSTSKTSTGTLLTITVGTVSQSFEILNGTVDDDQVLEAVTEYLEANPEILTTISNNEIVWDMLSEELQQIITTLQNTDDLNDLVLSIETDEESETSYLIATDGENEITRVEITDLIGGGLAFDSGYISDDGYLHLTSEGTDIEGFTPFYVGTDDYYTKEEIDEKVTEITNAYSDADTAISERLSSAESTVSELESSVNSIENAVADVIASDTGLTVSYIDGTTKNIDIDTGTVIDSWYWDTDYYLHLYDSDGNDIIDPVYIAGGGSGSSSSGTATITRVTSASTQCIYGNDMNIEFTFEATDSSGDLVGDGTGTWYVGGVVKATSTVTQGTNTFNIGSYLSSGSNTVKLSVSVDTGGESNTVVTKTWSVNAVNMYFTWSYDDAQINTSAIIDRYTPYGDVSKTTYTYLDGELLDSSTTSRSGVSQSLTIPMQTHGAHMVERYVTATE